MKCYKCDQEACEGQGYCLACHAAHMRTWRKTHPLSEEQRRRNNCRAYLNVYVRRGKIQRGRCEVCGSKAAQAHHADYTKPLVVNWLCRAHHHALTGLERDPGFTPAGQQG